ncbi:MAG: TadE family protein [Pirellulales bacterium]
MQSRFEKTTSQISEHVDGTAVSTEIALGKELACSHDFAAGKQTKLENSCRYGRNRRRGAAAVEFAIVAPIFFLFVFGIIEYGRMVMVQQVITNASREGARRAVLDGASAAAVTTSVEDYLDSAAINGDSATVLFPQGDPENASFGAPVEVRIEVPFNDVSWMPTPFFLKGKTLGASTVMRRETVQ